MKSNADKTLKLAFDAVADLYDKVRPDYPQQLIDDIISISRIPSGGAILEVGSGSGQATAAFADKGYAVHCIEPGKNLVDIAKKKFADNPKITFEVGFFEESTPKEGAYDLIISATAFHWVPVEEGYPLTAKALKPGGTIALFWNMHPELDPDVYEALRGVYKEYVPNIHASTYKLDKKSAKEEAKGGEAEINKSGFFEPVSVRHYNWSQDYTSEQYTKLLNTYANYQNLDDKVRETFFEKVREVIDTKFGGKITNHYLVVLYTAKVDVRKMRSFR